MNNWAATATLPFPLRVRPPCRACRRGRPSQYKSMLVFSVSRVTHNYDLADLTGALFADWRNPEIALSVACRRPFKVTLLTLAGWQSGLFYCFFALLSLLYPVSQPGFFLRMRYASP